MFAAKPLSADCRFDYKLGRDRVFIKACRDLTAGEEVFVSYGSTYWRNSRSAVLKAILRQLC